MNCPDCGKPAEEGAASFTPLQGFSSTLLFYTSPEESRKSFLKRKSKSSIILAGTEVRAYYCADCKKVMPVFEVNSI